MYSGINDSDKVAHMRKQQIDTLKIFNDRVIEVTEGTEYKVEFNINGNLFNIIVLLSKDFPLEKPNLKVEPSVRHGWVNPNNGDIILAPGLLKFTIHSELGRVVQAIIREFELRPPPLAEGFQNDTRTDNLAASSVGCVGSSNGDTTIVSNLNSLSVSQLEKINTDPEELEEFISKLPVLVDLSKSLEEETTKIATTASENIEREDELLTLKSEVNKLTAQLSETFDEYRILTAEYSKLCEKYDPHSIRESLVQSISKVDEESEKIADNFLNGEIDLEKFLTDFSSHRYLSHLRKSKAENLGQQLNKLHQSRF